MIRVYWLRDGLGKPLTLDWSAVKAIAEMTDYPMDRSEVKKIQSLERISQQYYRDQAGREG